MAQTLLESLKICCILVAALLNIKWFFVMNLTNIIVLTKIAIAFFLFQPVSLKPWHFKIFIKAKEKRKSDREITYK